MRSVKAQPQTHQERQKQKSRESILQAAKAVLAEKSYAAMAIEDVIARAGVSRATFYKYFDSKFAIGRELHAEFAPRLSAAYDELLAYDDPAEADLVDWIKQLVALYRENRDLIVTFAHMLATEPAFHPIMINIIRETELRWARRIPAFRLTGLGGTEAMRAHIESRLLLRQLNDFCYEVAIFDWPIDLTEGCRIMAGYFRSFFDRYRLKGTAVQAR
jgi:AcrR family transcriptional regulator